MLQQGLTLIELMIALLISTLILAGLVQIFTMNRSTYQSDEGLARLQENARFAMEFLGRELRNVGNMGCFNMPPLSASGGAQNRNDKYLNYVSGPTNYIYNAQISITYDMTQPLRGFDSTAVTNGMYYNMPQLYPPALTTASTPPIPNELRPASFAVGSDVLLVRSMDQDSYPLVAKSVTDPAAVRIQAPNTIDVGHVVIASNCEKAATFQVTGIVAGAGFSALAHDTSGTPGNTCALWGSAGCKEPQFEEGSELAVLRTMVYYVGPGTNGGPSLFRNSFTSGSAVAEELVEGIENMQLLYNDGTRYMEARDVTNWSVIRSVRVGILAATSNVVTAADYTPGDLQGGTEMGQDTNQYLMQNVTFVPTPDKRRRRSFETTIQVRNRL
jgi:type IV pilus assembly protein PilW